MADGTQPNVLVISRDDIGITNLSRYSAGLMGHRTPNIDRLAHEAMRFTIDQALAKLEAAITSGR